MVNKILVPTDFSPLAESALKFAVEISKTTGAGILLAHVLEPPSASYGSLDVSGQIETEQQINEEMIFTKVLVDRVKLNLQKLSQEYSKEGAKVHYKVYFDSPYKGIMDRVTEDDVDLIIMGTKGATGMREILVGSNAEKVVRNAKVPVIAIKSETDIHSPKKLVLASDFSEDLDKAMHFIVDFQKLMKAEIHLLRINTPNDFHNSRSLHKIMNDFAKRHSLSDWHKHIYCDVVEEDGIIYFSEEIDADMIIMPTHGRKGITHLLGGSVSEDVVNHSKRPVMTLKIK